MALFLMQNESSRKQAVLLMEHPCFSYLLLRLYHKIIDYLGLCRSNVNVTIV